ncbi:MAG: DUF4878 domain-containing protein [Acidobacteria bacterium]|nr:DUF4878 domain-containing protein [Acidobacteriota bacterium]NIM60269.1 DUF4878 domain-containing protein [Acidobacteriota bacterium]NIO57872.1 DUF4878 domain-containing protein [Acidobacteriota bacterium]NIQ28881.1 DUF4878 domain-containing protein [Acidobacteriota bacterium]NIQ83339.1 DUF4878 domain-containing protein [Acidobacteriota bacterium]
MPLSPLTRVLLVALLLAPVVACSGGGGAGGDGSDAVSVVRTFYDHLNAGNYDDAKALYTTDTRDQIFIDADSEEGFRNWAVVETHNQSLTDLKVLTETKGEDGVTIEFELVFGDGESSQRRVTVTQEEGAWRLGFIG